eukprot:TRINITY_DN37536_c0_g1_i3.p1 TRINITY_DN37536_c0_g1~~TRINITY_DN37536_c0_g1_i3.p1  ORF type:complete len:103 (+),score=32.16 TRINITY_DN37536_c0_g1_i3:123-431(+)
MIRRPPRSTLSSSSAASDVYKRQPCLAHNVHQNLQPKADSCCYDLLCLNPASMYGQVRNEYGIVTDFPVCEDVCLPLICAPCALNRAFKQSAKPRGGGYSNI